MANNYCSQHLVSTLFGRFLCFLYSRDSQPFLARGPLEAPILFPVDLIVQQYAIKVTKRGPSRSPVDPGWEPLLYSVRHICDTS